MKTKYIYLLLAGIFALMSCEEDATPILELKTAAALHALSQTLLLLKTIRMRNFRK